MGEKLKTNLMMVKFLYTSAELKLDVYCKQYALLLEMKIKKCILYTKKIDKDTQ